MGASAVTPAMQDYLEVILSLGPENQAVRITDIASRRGIAKASVSQAVAGLRRRGLVRQEPYGRVTLTESGLREAELVARRHRTLRSFLSDVLGVAPRQAEEEACRLEHAISQDTLVRLVGFLEAHAPAAHGRLAEGGRR
ncbi:MAG: metal-dependent transcriptional regulator [Firmicutes bacterium]|nr:metal-dependent transcriptional regulator [Bacillota bacterium]